MSPKDIATLKKAQKAVGILHRQAIAERDALLGKMSTSLKTTVGQTIDSAVDDLAQTYNDLDVIICRMEEE